MKKKILITASTFPRWEGDTEPRFILDYCKALTKYYDVTVLVPAATGAKSNEILEGVNVIRYHYLPIHKWETLCYPGAIVPRIKERRIRALQVPFLFFALWVNLFKLRKNFDFVHAHWLIPQGIIQPFASTNYLLTGHGTDVTSMNTSIIGKLKKNTLNKAKHITVVSNRLKKIVIDTYGISSNKISVISMGCDTSIFSPDYRNKECFSSNNKKNIIFVGRLEEIKGVEYLIDAMEYIDANLYIIGKGMSESALKARAKNKGAKITFLGPKNHKELPEIYASADVMVVPSVTTQKGEQEGLGLVIIEAMASGIPVVASRSGGIVDIITHGENGLLAPEKEPKELAYQINQLLSDEHLYSHIRENGFLTAKKYDYDVIALKYKKIIDAIQK